MVFTIGGEHSIKEDIQEHYLKEDIEKVQNFTNCKLKFWMW